MEQETSSTVNVRVFENVLKFYVRTKETQQTKLMVRGGYQRE